jgi:tetratricopeptide (TPR) repeat protein
MIRTALSAVEEPPMRKTTIIALLAGILGCNPDQKPIGWDSSAEVTMTARDWFQKGNDLCDSDKEGALAAYTEAIRLEASMDAAYFNRALTYSELGRDREAVDDKETLLT